MRAFKGATFFRPLLLWWLPAALGAVGFALIPNDLCLVALAVGTAVTLGLSRTRPWLRRRRTARLRIGEATVVLDKKVVFARSELAGVVSVRHLNCWMVTLFDAKGTEITLELAELEHGVLMRELDLVGLPGDRVELRAPMTWPAGAALAGILVLSGVALRVLAPRLEEREPASWLVLGLVIAAIPPALGLLFRRDLQLGFDGIHVMSPFGQRVFAHEHARLRAAKNLAQIVLDDGPALTFECTSARAATALERACDAWSAQGRKRHETATEA